MALDFSKLDKDEVLSESFAQKLDSEDEIKHLRSEFLIPTRSQITTKYLDSPTTLLRSKPHDLSIYLCGNSLGLQPHRTSTYVQKFLHTWATQGVFGHFKPMVDAATVPWLHLDDEAAEKMVPIVGAKGRSEVAVMQTLTGNLHLAMAGFYRPDKQRWKVIMEGKSFPSDYYAMASQLHHHGLDPATSLILIEPSDPESHYFSTEHVLSVIEEHASTTAVLLLPGVHFYSGQFLDIPTITKYAQDREIIVGWDLAHAVGNVPLKLHEWNVDFAAWCSYKYLNSGAGSIGGLFVHERHGSIHEPKGFTDDSLSVDEKIGYRPRLSGWWGSSKTSRFQMDNVFAPMEGAAGWQLSNPSALDTTSLLASLSVFNETDMATLRKKSLQLTAYLEHLLLNWPVPSTFGDQRPYTLLTPSNPEERGAQISVKLDSGLLEGVMDVLEREAVVVDERKPDVIRVAPAPLYNNYSDVWRFMTVFIKALEEVKGSMESKEKGKEGDGTMTKGPQSGKGWSEIT